MERITLGQIAVAVALVVGLVSGFAYLYTMLKKWIKTAFHDEFDEINRRVDSIELEACKNFLVRSVTELERGGDLDEINKQRVYECFERYQAAGGNGYIRRKIEQLQEEGKL